MNISGDEDCEMGLLFRDVFVSAGVESADWSDMSGDLFWEAAVLGTGDEDVGGVSSKGRNENLGFALGGGDLLGCRCDKCDGWYTAGAEGFGGRPIQSEVGIRGGSADLGVNNGGEIGEWGEDEAGVLPASSDSKGNNPTGTAER